MTSSDQIAHCVLFSDLGAVASNQTIEIQGEEAHHAARVKRIRPGERVGVLDGQGRFGTGILEAVVGSRSNPVLRVVLNEIAIEPPICPELVLAAALPKGDRLDRMIDLLTQMGVARYQPLICERSQRKPETIRPDKLQRIADEAMKQCRRPWRLQIGDPIRVEDALADRDAVVADASGDVWVPGVDTAARTLLLVGPEGGWSNTERGLFVDSGVRMRRFGRYVLRIEAAAVAAAAMVMGSDTHTGS